ncbi:hypothetical protein Tco_0749056 [Tanacetum coccineum]|uniref:Uncharacterized protein n=1 Tax=Tanacetum coccineum TaxID=301880 RepID=A0ABQ4YXM1_9ASTR
MLRVLTITLIGTAKRLVDRLSQGTINTWDLLKNAFIQRNGGRYQVGPPGYYTRMDNQPTLGERRPSLAEIITKYMEDSAKKEAGHDEWLRKFQETKEKNQRGHDEIIRNLETKDYHFIHCSTTLLRNQIFLADSSLSDEEVQEEIEEAKEINDEAVQREPTNQMLTLTLIHKAIKSLKRIKINRPFLKEIRKTDDYAQHMKNLGENKLRTLEDEDVKMNTRCSAILQNQLPPKEQDQGSFTLPYSIIKLTFNALADLEESISVMPLLMFRRLGIGGLKPINMTIEMADGTQITPKGIVEI